MIILSLSPNVKGDKRDLKKGVKAVKNPDPVREMIVKYPRILVIKAALRILKKGDTIDKERIEKVIINIMKKKS